MELHQLRYFVAVAEERNFSRAAERVHVAQPSLSQQIQKLEAEVGQPLLDRLPRNVVLTEAGKRFLGFARNILMHMADAQRCVDECKGEAVGRIVVGAIPTIAPYFLPRVLQEFKVRHPKVAVELVEDVTDTLARQVEEGALDLALVSNCRGSASVYREHLGKEPLFAAVPTQHRLAQKKAVAWRDLKDEKFLSLHEAHCLSQQVNRLCAANKLHPQIVLRGVQLNTVIGLIAAGMGVSLVPQMLIDSVSNPGCTFLPFTQPIPEREINLIRNPLRYQTKGSAAFAECCRFIVEKVPSKVQGA